MFQTAVVRDGDFKPAKVSSLKVAGVGAFSGVEERGESGKVLMRRSVSLWRSLRFLFLLGLLGIELACGLGGSNFASISKSRNSRGTEVEDSEASVCCGGEDRVSLVGGSDVCSRCERSGFNPAKSGNARIRFILAS